MPKVRPITPIEAKRSLVSRLGPRVDRLRQFCTKFGLRPLKVFLVYLKYTGAEYGEGEQKEAQRIELLPTPKVQSMSDVALQPLNAGIEGDGGVTLTKVSSRYTFDQLRGLYVPERHEDHLEPPYFMVYEIVEDGRGDPQPVRQTFRLASLPERRAGQIDWTLKLQRVSGGNDRTGEPTYGDSTA
jgi:hypothetical protein